MSHRRVINALLGIARVADQTKTCALYLAAAGGAKIEEMETFRECFANELHGAFNELDVACHELKQDPKCPRIEVEVVPALIT